MEFLWKKYTLSLTLLAFGGMIVLLFLRQKLLFFVYPLYIPLIVGCAIVLCILGIHILSISQKKFLQSHFSEHIALWQVLCIAIPIVLGTAVEPRPLSSQTALLRGVNSDFSLTLDTDNTFEFSFNPAERNFREWIGALALNPEPSHHVGAEVHITGMVVFDENLPKNYFYLTRFQLSCCAADARPVGIPVFVDPQTREPIPKKESWITLNGVIAEQSIRNERKAVIVLHNFTPVEIPDDPYIY